MPSVSEEILELSAQLLLAAAGDLSKIMESTGKIVADVGSAALIEIINAAKNKQLSIKDKRALGKIEDAVKKDGEVPKQVTILETDLKLLEKWLKKQNVLYAALRSETQTDKDGREKCMVVFLDKDREAVDIAVALTRYERGYINELPPQGFLLLHEKKDIAVIDNLDIYELEVFREVAKDYGLVYSAISKPSDVDNSNSNSYEILVSNKDLSKATAIMQQISWAMTGEFQEGIKEKVKEHYLIKDEIQKIVSEGVESGKVTIKTENAGSLSVEKAKYIVNKMATNQFLKITAQGFTHYKFGKEIETVSTDDSEYLKKIQLALGEFSGAVVFDSEEWEKGGLNKANLRKNEVLKKLSVFPVGFNKKKDAEEIQKARKHREPSETYSETAWLFDKYDSKQVYSEVYEMNYDNSSEPPERTVSVHYNDAVKHSEKYKYIDVSNDEKSIDNIILVAKERSMSNPNFEKVSEKEIS